jgi:outer membrane lipoprotein-sorting protein
MRRGASLTLALGLAAAAPAMALTGREVIDTAQQKNGFSTWHDRKASATMESYDKEKLARTRELDVTEQTDPRGEHRTFLEFTGPHDVQDTLFLHLSPRGEKDQQWVWTPAARKARRLGEAQQDENFFGTDLSYRDLELLVRIQQWNDAESTATLAADETIDGKSCHVVELAPKNVEFSYPRYELWFGTDDALLWRVDVYDAEDRVVKRITLGRYERFEKYATPMEANIANVQADTHTIFRMRDVRYDKGVDDSVFSLSNLSRGR